LQVLKIAKQTSSLSYAGITKQLIANKGLVGILDGFFPWGSLQVMQQQHQQQICSSRLSFPCTVPLISIFAF